MEDTLLAPSEAMLYANLTGSTFYRYIRLGRLVPDKKGMRDQPLFYESTLNKFLGDRVPGATGDQSQGKSLYLQNAARPVKDEVHPNGATIHWSERHRRNGDTYVPITCSECGDKTFKRDHHLMKGLKDGSFTGQCTKCYRSAKRRSQLKGDGRYVDKDGYVKRHRLTFTVDEWEILKNMDNHGYILEHRAVVALAIGRPLKPNEVVHHKNGVKDQNEIDNLMIVPHEDHGKFHSQILAKLGDLEMMQAKIEELESRILYLESIIKPHL